MSSIGSELAIPRPGPFRCRHPELVPWQGELPPGSGRQGCDRGFRSARTRFGAYFRPSYLLGRTGKSIQMHTKSIQMHTKCIQKHTNAYKTLSSNQLDQDRANPAQSQPWQLMCFRRPAPLKSVQPWLGSLLSSVFLLFYIPWFFVPQKKIGPAGLFLKNDTSKWKADWLP